MNHIAKIQNYHAVDNNLELSIDWMSQLNRIIETRHNDELTIEQLLQLMVNMTGSDNISIAVPDSDCLFQAKYCSRQVEGGVYSFTVQNYLSQVFDSGSVVLVRKDTSRAEAFSREALTAFDFKQGDHCLLIPLRLRQTTLAVIVLDLRKTRAGSLSLKELWFMSTQIAQTIATQVVPNFQTLYARPYQRVNESELSDIQCTVTKCGGNKTMAAKMLGLTPRQLRYRLSKLS